MNTLIAGGLAVDDITLPGVKLQEVAGGAALYASLAA